jgi:hypothetical protein
MRRIELRGVPTTPTEAPATDSVFDTCRLRRIVCGAARDHDDPTDIAETDIAEIE